MRKLVPLLVFSGVAWAQYYPPQIPSANKFTPSPGASAGTVDCGTGSGTYGFCNNPIVFDLTLAGTTATDSASLGPELTTAGTCSGAGWTGTYPNYAAPGTTAPLTCTGFTSGMFYQTVTSIGAGGSGAVTIVIGAAQTASGTSGTLTAGLKADGTSLTYTPAATYTGIIGISAKLITPISNYSVTGKDSTGAISAVESLQGLAALHNLFGGGGGTYNTTGSSNVANGYQALLSSTTGSNNVASGYQALFSNTTGSNNVANGNGALLSNTTGTSNVANGAGALFNNTAGSSNVANGYHALLSSTTGSNNVASGNGALSNNTTGSNNVANGFQALFSNTTGSTNVANGYQAGYTAAPGNANTTGSQNTYDGYQCGANTATQLNNTFCIGYQALVAASNTGVLGNASVTDVYEGGPGAAAADHAIADVTVPVLTANLRTCTASTGTPWRASVTDASSPSLGAALTGGGSTFANVHCSLTTGTYIVDGL